MRTAVVLWYMEKDDSAQRTERGGVMTSEDILTALGHLAESLDLVGAVTYGRRGSKIATIEAFAHEIAHRVFSGPTFEPLLVKMSPCAANRHEASALRVEIAVLDRLGCRISLRTLWANANWHVDSKNKRPPWATMTLPFTVREERCVIAIIKNLRRSLRAVTAQRQRIEELNAG